MERPQKVQSSKVVHQNPYYMVRQDKYIRKNNSKGDYYYIEAEPFVIVAALSANGKSVHMVKTWRYAIRRYSWEFPMGWVEKNETPLIAAKRELAEEVGLKAKKWKRLGWFYLAPAISKQKGYIYLAQGLAKAEQQELDKEIVDKKKVSLAALKKMVKEHKVIDSPTLVASQYLLK